VKTRFPIIVITLALSLLLAACASSAATQAPVEPTEPPTPEPTEAPTEAPAAEPVTLRVGAKCGPTGHVMPLFVVLAQTGGELDGVQIVYVPVTGPDQMTALVSNGDVDVWLGNVLTPAKMHVEGVPIHLYSTSMTKGFYVLANEGITGWADLQRERVLMPDPASGPSRLAMASMRVAGFDPEADFTIENMPASQIIQLMVAGEAPAAVISEPHVTITIGNAKKEGITLKPSAIDLYAIYISETWPEGQLPLDGVSATTAVLEDEAAAAALETFITAYNDSIDFMLSNPAEASKLIAQQLTEQCDSKMKPDPLEKSFSSGRLQYDPRPVGELLPDLDAYIELILGREVDEGYYAQP
jgi:NitT/TauT family transport system substrate-binding protein